MNHTVICIIVKQGHKARSSFLLIKTKGNDDSNKLNKIKLWIHKRMLKAITLTYLTIYAFCDTDTNSVAM